jgi:hypothetical protein
MKSYDTHNPGLIGIYTIKHAGYFEHRKWDGTAWHMAGNGHDLQRALAMNDPHDNEKYMRNYCEVNKSREDFIIMYVSDLQGNQVPPREARRIGDPPWFTAFQPEQLELF